MPTALIIGASRGIGHEFVRQLRAAGWKVIATARTDDALQALRDEGAEAFKLDVLKPESLAGLGWQLDDEKLDLAVYVSGFYGSGGQAASMPTADDFDKVMRTNVLGAMQAIPLVAPLVESRQGKFVFISSGMGSIGEAESSHGWVYRASKAALNMAVKSASFDYPKATLVAMNPGWVKTDMGGADAPTSVEDSVAGMLKVIAGLGPEHSGSFQSYDGRSIVW